MKRTKINKKEARVGPFLKTEYAHAHAGHNALAVETSSADSCKFKKTKSLTQKVHVRRSSWRKIGDIGQKWLVEKIKLILRGVITVWLQFCLTVLCSTK